MIWYTNDPNVPILFFVALALYFAVLFPSQVFLRIKTRGSHFNINFQINFSWVGGSSGEEQRWSLPSPCCPVNRHLCRKENPESKKKRRKKFPDFKYTFLSIQLMTVPVISWCFSLHINRCKNFVHYQSEVI